MKSSPHLNSFISKGYQVMAWKTGGKWLPLWTGHPPNRQRKQCHLPRYCWWDHQTFLTIQGSLLKFLCISYNRVITGTAVGSKVTALGRDCLSQNHPGETQMSLRAGLYYSTQYLSSTLTSKSDRARLQQGRKRKATCRCLGDCQFPGVNGGGTAPLPCRV